MTLAEERSAPLGAAEEPELPEGWIQTPLGALLELKYGRGLTESNRRHGPTPVYGSNGVVGYHNEALTAGPTLVVGRKGTVGAVHYSAVPCWPIDTTYYVDQFHGLEGRWTYFALKHLDLGQHDTSTAVPGLNRGDAYSQPVLLPPLAEQRRIVAQVEALLARTTAARERLAKVPAILKRFRQAVLAAACDGRLTEDWRELRSAVFEPEAPGSRVEAVDDHSPALPAGWSWRQIAEIGKVQGGIQKQPIRQPRSNHFPYLRVANVLRGRLDLSEVHRMELFAGELDRYRLEPNDLLIVEGNGSITEIGRCAIWDGAIENCVHQNHIIRVRLSGPSPRFVSGYWNSPLGSANVAAAAVTTAGLYSLSTKKVARLPVPVPPEAEQDEVVRRVEALLALADKIERRVATATLRAEKLTQAVLAKAFRGELVPTEAELARLEGREYEPASQLLERIRRERAAPTRMGLSRKRQRRGPST